MVDDQSLTARRSSFYAHHAVFDIHSHQLGLLQCAIGQVAAGNLLGDVTSLSALIEHHLFQEGVLGVFLGWRQVDCARSVDVFLYKDHPASRLFQGYPRTTERPSRTCCHIHLNTVALCLRHRIAQHAHPFVREVGDIILLIALNTVEWGYLDGSDAMFAIFSEIPFEVLLVDGRSQPPPACARLGLWCDRRPRLCIDGQRQ